RPACPAAPPGGPPGRPGPGRAPPRRRAALAAPGSSLTVAQGLTAHTVGGHRAADNTVPLAGAAVSCAVWACESGRRLNTVQRGRVLFDILDSAVG
ncbi:MAG: hypothetical protein L0I24_10900, partial [Pseudonocardia sp.]|nr:hypothetical protein [Pseudonocardia sp.]